MMRRHRKKGKKVLERRKWVGDDKENININEKLITRVRRNRKD